MTPAPRVRWAGGLGFLLVTLLVAPAHARRPTAGAEVAARDGSSSAPAPVPDPVTIGISDARLTALVAESWEASLVASPLFASSVGDHRFDDQLDDHSAPARTRFAAQRAGWLARAARITALSGEDRVHHAVFQRQLRDEEAVEAACGFSEWSISARGNAFTFAADLGREEPLNSAERADALVSRFRAVPRWIRDDVANLRLGLAGGRVANRASIQKVIDMLDVELAAPSDAQALLALTREPLPGLSEAEAARFRGELGALAAGPIRQALQEYREFLKVELLPRARGEGEEGLAFVRGGADCYAARARQETTTELGPDALHALGVEALAGIHAEMREIGGRLFGTSELRDILTRLRSDPALHFDSREAVVATAEASLARARTARPRFFSPMPAAECVVKPIPDHEAPYTTIAYYWPAAPDGSAPGVYYVNSWEPTTRTRFDAEALAWHEAIPGHHLQIALATEAGELPQFRRMAGFSAFVEGWALYAERLADEMGLYSGDLDRLGMLGFDSWRASRLVVDTGIHDLGWSRAEAEAFLLENTPLAPNNITNEVDRYITWPGQALAYKTGQIELMRMRRAAEAELGPRFDLPGFHHAVLGGGALPLDLVEARVKAWVATRR
jgi:uncharacterized protein (DUF885 family)